MNLADFTFVPFVDSDLNEVLCSPILGWINRVPVGSYVRYRDKYVFKTEDAILACYVDNLESVWEI